MNACLTVRQGNPNSHKDRGWERLTDAVVKYIRSLIISFSYKAAFLIFFATPMTINKSISEICLLLIIRALKLLKCFFEYIVFPEWNFFNCNRSLF